MATADLSVTKTASSNPIGIGQPLTYTIKVRNNGPDTATSIGLKDTIPPGVYISSITVTQGSYCYQNGIITWDVGTQNAGQDGTMTVTVIPENAGTISNTANVYLNNQSDIDPNPNNNLVTVDVKVDPSVDLILSKDSCPKDATIGNPINYSIKVINNGPSTANNVVVTDTLPSGVTVQSISTSQGSYQQSGNIITFNLGILNINDRANMSIIVIPNVEGSIKNTAKVTSREPDINSENNEDSVVNNVGAAADILITKTVSSDVVVIGQIFTYNLIVKNLGPSPATNVQVVDTLPSSVELVSITQSQGSYSQSGNVITFNLDNLLSNGTATIEIKVKATAVGMIKNLAIVSADQIDPNKSNNTASVCTFVNKADIGTDISVEKNHSPETAGICSPVLYTITVTNNGPINATGIILDDQIPPSLEIMNVTCSQGKCCICNDEGCYPPPSCCHHDMQKEGSSSNQYHREEYKCHEGKCIGSTELICQLGSLAVGKSAVVKVCVKPKVSGSIENTAIVTANEEDFNTTNNESTDTLIVITVHDQIDNLINKINELISSGEIDEKYGKILIACLNDVKVSVCCNNINEAKNDLNNFINRVNMYIQKEIISEEQGCALIKAAEMIKQGIKCSCTC